MREPIAQRKDRAPLDLGRRITSLLGQRANGLTDYDESVENGITGDLRRTFTRAVGADPLDCVEDVGQPFLVVAAQSFTASAIARRRTSGISTVSVETSTSTPTISLSSAESAASVMRVRPRGRSTSRSTSLLGVSSPRATEPKRRTLEAPRLSAAARMASRFARSRCSSSDGRCGREARTSSSPQARKSRRRLGIVGTTPPRSQRATAGCEVPARAASSSWVRFARLRAARRRTAASIQVSYQHRYMVSPTHARTRRQRLVRTPSVTQTPAVNRRAAGEPGGCPPLVASF
jgi:hypothetical protein